MHKARMRVSKRRWRRVTYNCCWCYFFSPRLSTLPRPCGCIPSLQPRLSRDHLTSPDTAQATYGRTAVGYTRLFVHTVSFSVFFMFFTPCVCCSFSLLFSCFSHHSLCYFHVFHTILSVIFMFFTPCVCVCVVVGAAGDPVDILSFSIYPDPPKKGERVSVSAELLLSRFSLTEI